MTTALSSDRASRSGSAPPLPRTSRHGSNKKGTSLERKSVRPSEAADLLGVCRDTVYVLMRSGRLRSIKAGSARLIPVAAIDELLALSEESVR